MAEDKGCPEENSGLQKQHSNHEAQMQSQKAGNEQEQTEIVETKREQIEDELADIGMFLLELADNLNVDLLTAIEAKMEKNAAKYPVEKSKGRSVKYTEL